MPAHAGLPLSCCHPARGAGRRCSGLLALRRRSCRVLSRKLTGRICLLRAQAARQALLCVSLSHLVMFGRKCICILQLWSCLFLLPPAPSGGLDCLVSWCRRSAFIPSLLLCCCPVLITAM